MDIMDTTIVNVALPTLADASSTPPRPPSSGWSLGYLLSLAVWIPASGWIGDRFGTKKIFLFALAMFTIASALCGQAHNLSELIAFRVLQGVGGGMLTPVGTAMLFRAFPPAERAKAVDRAHHADRARAGARPDHRRLARHRRLVALDLLRQPARRHLRLRLRRSCSCKEHREPTAGRFDLAGFVLSGVGLALVLYALSQAPEKGWLSTEVVVTGLVGPRAVRGCWSASSSHIDAPDAGAAPLQGAHVPQRQHRVHVLLRRLRRRALPAAAVPAGAAAG